MDEGLPVGDPHSKTFAMNIDEPQPAGIVLP